MTTIIRNARFSPQIEGGFRGTALRFDTAVFASATGRTTRVSRRQQALGRWSLSVISRPPDDPVHTHIRNMIAACRGRKYGFLFRDPEDHKLVDTETIDGQLYKRYPIYDQDTGDEIDAYLRPITRPILGNTEFLVPVAFADDFIDTEMVTMKTVKMDVITIEEVIE